MPAGPDALRTGALDFLDDQQPIGRVIGRRANPPAGRLPSAPAREAMAANARYRTRVPKGEFAYSSHDEMTRDRELWTLEAVLARRHARG